MISEAVFDENHNVQEFNVEANAIEIKTEKVVEEPTEEMGKKAPVRRSRRKSKKTKPLEIGPVAKKSKIEAATHQSLNDQTGKFYVCHCMLSEKTNHIVPVLQEEDLRNLNSDTETTSESEIIGKVANSSDTKQYYCKSCGNEYRVKKKLLQHVKIHKNVCKLCDKKFRSKKLFKQHLMQHITEKYVCHFCEKEFAYKPSLLDHIEEHMKTEMYDSVLKLEDDYTQASNEDSFSDAYINYNNSYYSRINPDLSLDDAKYSTMLQNYSDLYTSQVYPSAQNGFLTPTETEPIYCCTCDYNMVSWLDVHQHMSFVHGVEP